jgi:hypothetical protein
MLSNLVHLSDLTSDEYVVCESVDAKRLHKNISGVRLALGQSTVSIQIRRQGMHFRIF